MRLRETGLRPFIENVRSNAPQRAQLAQDLYARQGDSPVNAPLRA